MFHQIHADSGMQVFDSHECAQCRQTHFAYVPVPDYYRRECLTPACERLFNGFIPRNLPITVAGKFGR